MNIIDKLIIKLKQALYENKVHSIQSDSPSLHGLKMVRKSWKKYIDGKINGLYTMWYEGGQKWPEGNYVDGKENGLHITWFENGQKRREELYKMRELINEKEWNEKGKEIKR
jgi:hypothetical protein